MPILLSSSLQTKPRSAWRTLRLVVGLDQNWLKKELNILNIIMVLILFYGNVFHYYIHDYNYNADLRKFIIVEAKIPCPTTSREPEKNVIRDEPLENL